MQIIDVLFQPVEQHFVIAFAVDALTRQVQRGDVLVRYAIANAFTAAIVVIPQHVDARSLNDIQHAFLVLCQLFFVVLTRHIREHARY